MGVKKKEEKKQEDVIDISTLPPCRTLFIAINWHQYLSSLQKYLKLNDFKVISREDLLLSLKEKSLEFSPKNLVQMLKSKIDEVQLPIRKEKKDSAKPDSERFDLMIIFKGFPTTLEETLELDAFDIQIEIFLYMRPTSQHQKNHFKRKTEQYSLKVQEASANSTENQILTPPIFPDLYPPAVYTLDKFSIEKESYKQFIVRVKHFESEEDLEFKEEIKEEKEEVKKKDVKPSPRKGEENKEEEIDVSDPKFKFCVAFVEEIKNVVMERMNFETWKKNLKPSPLFPENSTTLRPSNSQGSLSSSDKKSEVAEKVNASKDDIQKIWDFSYFYANLKKVPEEICNSQMVLTCILRWICRDHLDCSLYSPSLSKDQAITILSQNNNNKIKGENIKYYMSETLVTDSIENLLKNLNIPGINRYKIPDPVPVSQRNSETASILSFSSSPPKLFERFFTLLTFENMLKKVHSERHWDFGNRCFEESLSLDDFFQIFLKSTEFSPEMLTEYIERTDSLLVCIFFKTPPGRIIRKAWKTPWKVCPNFSQYMSILDSKNIASHLYDIDPNRVGPIKERCKIMYPADNSVIKMIEYHIGSRKPKYHESLLRPRYRPIVYKDGWYFGIRKIQKKNEFWGTFHNERVLAEMGENGLELNFTLDSGLILKILPGGEILQQKNNSAEEENRIIYPNGSIARHFKDGTITLLMPSGEVSRLTKEKFWIITNSKGRRVARRQKVLYPMDPITVTTQIDAETLAKVTIREDLVMSLKFSDNSFAVFHEDGTRIYRSEDKNTVYIESPGYCPIRIYKDPIKARQNTVIGLGSSDSGLGAEDIMLRSNDGVLIEAFLPNGTKVQSFVQKQELEAYNQFLTNRINLVTRSDGTIIKTSQDGEVVFITTQARESLAKNSGPDAYFYDIFTLPEERNSGVYTARVDFGRLWTRDSEGNYFEVTTKGKAIERLSVSLNVEDLQPPSPEISQGEFIDPECKFLPPPATVISPRLFVIHNNEITELLEESQLKYHFDNNTGKYIKEKTKEAFCHTWINEKNNNDDFSFPGSPFVKYSLPKLVSPMLQTLILSDIPKPVSYVFRRIFEYPLLDEASRKKFESELENFEEWKKNKQNERESFFISDPRNEGEKAKYESFLARLGKFKGNFEVKAEIDDNDKVSEFFVELSEDELEFEIPESKVSNFRMESA